MLELFKNFFKPVVSWDCKDSLIEGRYADEYQSVKNREEIQIKYLKRWHQEQTPLTHPWLYDPCEPPEGWRYDPYYECWINFK